MEKVTQDILNVGVNDRDITLFEGQYTVENGMAYNSYVILDEQTAIMDTVDPRATKEWLANVKEALGGRKADYLVIQHMEPDHGGSILQLMAVSYTHLFVNVFRTHLGYPATKNIYKCIC